MGYRHRDRGSRQTLAHVERSTLFGGENGGKQADKVRITRITRIKGTDYTEHGGGIVRLKTLSVRRDYVFGCLVRIAFFPCNPCP